VACFSFFFNKKSRPAKPKTEDLYKLWQNTQSFLAPWEDYSDATKKLLTTIQSHASLYDLESNNILHRNQNLINLRAILTALTAWSNERKGKSLRIVLISAYKKLIENKLKIQLAKCKRSGDILDDKGYIDIVKTADNIGTKKLEENYRSNFKLCQLLLYLPIITFLSDQFFNLADMTSLIS